MGDKVYMINKSTNYPPKIYMDKLKVYKRSGGIEYH